MTTEVDKNSFEYVKNYVTKDRNVVETREIYSDWYDNYDNAMVKIGFNGPLLVVESFAELGLDKDVRILDVGAGTGKLGAELRKRGYNNLDAIEPSKLVEKAKRDKMYKNYYDCFVKLGQPLPFAKGTYDVAIMSGMLCPGHLHHEDLLELSKVVKPGGLVCWGSKLPGYYADEAPQYTAENIQKTMDKYVLDGVWKYYQAPKLLPKYYNDIEGMFYSMQVLKN